MSLMLDRAADRTLLDTGTTGRVRRMVFMPRQTDRIAGLRYHQRAAATQAERAIGREVQDRWQALSDDYGRRADEAELEKS